jgi:DNA-binding transcriptional regulator LsrR (DeoR family)
MILVHLDTNDSILLLCNDKSFHALYYIIKQMDLDTNIWYADKINKTTIANRLEISLASLEKMIASLKRNNLIRPTSRGIYQLTELLRDY